VTVTTDLGERLAARVQGRRKTRLAITSTVVVLLLLGGAAGWLLLGTGVLGVRDVQVTGTSLLDPAEVRSVAAIRPGAPLATLDTGAVVSRLSRLPAVRAVEVTRHWPRTVEIRVHERVAAAVQARGPAYMLVDRSGVAFAPVDRRPAGLPLVSAPVDEGAPALRAALDVLEQLPAAVRDQAGDLERPEMLEVVLVEPRCERPRHPLPVAR
jgi:cell division protein FtsQ